MDDFRDAIAAWHTQALILATGHYVDWIKAQPIASDGKYFPGQYTNEWLLSEHGGRINGSHGGGPAPSQSFQAAMVVSWGTLVPRGRAAKGRIYYPCGRSTNIGTGKMFGGNNEQDTLTTAAVALISALRVEWSGEHFIPAVAANDSAGTTRAIETVRIGDVMDTQRRRRRQLDEIYVSKPVPPL